MHPQSNNTPYYIKTTLHQTGTLYLDFLFFMYIIRHRFICRPSDSPVSEDAGIEPWTVGTLTLTDLIKLELHSWSNRFPTTSLLLLVTLCSTLNLRSSCGQINSEVNIESPVNIGFS
jgi:hypothetical protein